MSGDSVDNGSDGAAEAPLPARAARTTRPPSALAREGPRERAARRVTFPDNDSQLVTGCLEPVNPWQFVEEISAEELIGHYVESCKKHNTPPIEDVIQQIKTIGGGGGGRRGQLSLRGAALTPAACESLEAVLRRARFQRLDLRDTHLTDDTAVAMFGMIEYYESAAELDISGNKEFGILGWQACSYMVNKCQWLQQLEARDTSLSEGTAPILGRALRPACLLRCLHLQRSRLAGRPLLCLANALRTNKSLRELHIGDNQLMPEDANHLASLLRFNACLQLLDISNNDIQDTGVEAIADALAEQGGLPSPSSSSESPMSSPQSCSSSAPCQDRGLAILIVWNNNLTRHSGQHLSKALSRCRTLEVLNIGQNPLGGEAVNRLRGALQQNRSLLSLGVQGAHLGPEAAIALAEVIEDNPIIQRIDLRENRLQMAGLLALATALRSNQSVTRIDLDDAPPPPNGADRVLEEARLVAEIRSLCRRNEAICQSPPPGPTRRLLLASRKISLTCQSACEPPPPPPPERALSPPRATGRLRSPLPSPTPSPMSSPVPSPLHRSRFQVSRVADSPASDGTTSSAPPVARNFFGNSRFRVVTVAPSISVQAPELDTGRLEPTVSVSSQTDGESPKVLNSRFSIVRIVDKEKEGKCATSDLKQENIVQKEALDFKPSPNVVKDDSADEKALPETIVKNQDPFQLRKTDSEDSKVAEEKRDSVPDTMEPIRVVIAIKKNESESSLDSPDLEVSRLMHDQAKRSYDSSSSLDISGSSMESLNTLEVSTEKPLQATAVQTPKTPNIFAIDPSETYSSRNSSSKKRTNLSASSNESSLESSTYEAVASLNFSQYSNQSNLLNSSVSSNESVSPNIFGKHMKLHGSITSLEASVSSMDSYKSSGNVFTSPSEKICQNNAGSFVFPNDQNQLIESTDSGICQSENTAVKKADNSCNESFSSNEGTLTSNSNLSNLKSSVFSLGGESLSIESDSKMSETVALQEGPPRRVSSLLDVPSIGLKQRSRKISWVAPTNFPPSVPPQPKNLEEQQPIKVQSSLEKLLSIFHHTGSLFSRAEGSDKKTDSQSSSRRDSQGSMTGSSSSFWSWSLGSNNSTVSTTPKPPSAPVEKFNYTSSSRDATASSDRTARLTDSQSTTLDDEDPMIYPSESSDDDSSDPELRYESGDEIVQNDVNERYSQRVNLPARDTMEFKEILHNIVLPETSVGMTETAQNITQDFLIQNTIEPAQDVSLDSVILQDTLESVVTPQRVGDANQAVEDVSRVVVIQQALEESRELLHSIIVQESLEASEEELDDDAIQEMLDHKTESDPAQENEDLTVMSAEDTLSQIQTVEDFDTVSNITKEIESVTIRLLLDLEYKDVSCDDRDDATAKEISSEFTANSELVINNASSTIQENTNSVDIQERRTCIDNNEGDVESLAPSTNVLRRIMEESDSPEHVKDPDKECSILQTTDFNKIVSILLESSADEEQSSNLLNITKNDDVLKDNKDICEERDSMSNNDYDIVSEIRLEPRQTLLHCDNIAELNPGRCDNPEGAETVTTREDSSDLTYTAVQNDNLGLVVCDNGRHTQGSKSIQETDNTAEDVCYTVDLRSNHGTGIFKSDSAENVLSCDNNQDAEILKSKPCTDRDARIIVRPADFISKNESSNSAVLNLKLEKVLKLSTGSENRTSPADRQSSPESGPSVENLSSKVIRRIKENISPENTLTSSMSNTKALAQELKDKRNILGSNTAIWDSSPGLNVDKMEAILEVRETKVIDSDKQGDVITKLYSKNNKIDMDLDSENYNILDNISNVEERILAFDIDNSNSPIGATEDFILEDRKLDKLIFEIDPNENNLMDNNRDNIFVEEPTQLYEVQDVDEGKDALTILDLIVEDPISVSTEAVSIISEEMAAYIESIPTQSLSIESSALPQEIPVILVKDDDVGNTAISASKHAGPDLSKEYEIVINDRKPSIVELLDCLTLNDTLPGEKIIDSQNNSQDEEAVVQGDTAEEYLEFCDPNVSNIDVIVCPKSPVKIGLFEKALDDLSSVEIALADTSNYKTNPESSFKPVSILKKGNSIESKVSSSPKDIPEPKSPFPHYGQTHPIPSKKSFDSRRNVPVRCGSLPEHSSSSGCSPKSLPDSLLPQQKYTKSRSPVNTLGKIARDSLYALNMSEEEIEELRTSRHVASLESVRSLGSVSEDIPASSSNFGCRSSSDSKSTGPGASQESLASLGSISEAASENDNYGPKDYYESS